MRTNQLPAWAQPTDQRAEALEADNAPRFYSDAELADRDVLQAWMFEDDDECTDLGTAEPRVEVEYDDDAAF